MHPSLSVEFNVYDPVKGSAPVRTLRKEFDVNAWEVFSQTEADVVAFGRELNTLLLQEAVKKKKKPWWLLFWRKMLNWRRTAGGQSASGDSPISPPTQGSA